MWTCEACNTFSTETQTNILPHETRWPHEPRDDFIHSATICISHQKLRGVDLNTMRQVQQCMVLEKRLNYKIKAWGFFPPWEFKSFVAGFSVICYLFAHALLEAAGRFDGWQLSNVKDFSRNLPPDFTLTSVLMIFV